jgi:DHA2 family lincomycin resistance protein-like MFS transporter
VAPPKARSPKLIAAVAAFAAFLATFNETFLNVAFTPIMADFGVSPSTVQWLASGLMLGAAVMVPVSAFAYRSVPTRRLFVLTVALLVLGSLIGALAPSFGVLLLGRVVQALGTGLLIPIGMNITLEVAPREKLGAYMGTMGAMTTLGPSSSVLISGLLLSAFDWRSLLWVFMGLSLACMAFGAVVLTNIAELTHPKLDVPSVILVGLALVGLFYGLSSVFSGSVPLAAAAALVGAVCLVLFVRRQGKLEQPLIDLRPLRQSAFAVSVVINIIALLSIFAMNIIIPIFMQSVLGIAPLTAALVLFPAIALSCVLSPIAGKISDKHGPMGLLLTGFGLIAIFTAALSVWISAGSVVALALLYIPVIGGSALIIGPVQGYALARLAPSMAPHGVTVMSTGFQLAGCIGSSLMTGIYSAVLAGRMAGGEQLEAAASSGFLAAGLVTAAFAVAGFALVLWLRRRPSAVQAEVAEAPGRA